MSKLSRMVELVGLIGREGLLTGDRSGIRCLVHIRDAKVGYGRPRLLIEPVAGAGNCWVDAEMVELVARDGPCS